MSESRGAVVRLESVSFSYDKAQVIHGLSLDVPAGEMIALLGDSGSGKTTVLKLVAGLLRPNAGTIAIDEQCANASPAEKRRVGMVFQKPLLFPYLSVAENVGFSLRMRRAATSHIRRRVEETLAMVHLDGYGSRRPSQLSGGQEQRVALARALVSDPRILLLDEPFAALDESLRAEMRTLVRSIQRDLRMTAIFVTHDRAEAAAMTGRIAFLRAGRVEQCGTLREFYEAPSTLAAARFFGWQILPGTLQAGMLRTVLGRIDFPNSSLQGDVCVAFRPEAAELRNGSAPAATVESSVDLGARIRTMISFPSGEKIEVDHATPAFEPSTIVTAEVPIHKIRLFPRIDL